MDGFYGKNNLGDDLILIGFLDLLATYGIREATVVLRGSDPQLAVKIGKFRNIRLKYVVAHGPISGLLHILPTVLRQDLIVIGGGGLFPKDSWKGHLVRLLPLMLGKIAGCHTLLLGITVDPVRSWRTKIVWRIALRQTDMVIVRDSGSYRNLSSISSSIFGFCGRDLAFRFPYRIATKALSSTIDGPFVILAPANLWYSQSSRSPNEKYEKFVSDWVSVVRELQQRSLKVVLLPFYHPFDTKLCVEIQNQCENACILWDPNMKSLEERVKLFEDAKLVVGMG